VNAKEWTIRVSIREEGDRTYAEASVVDSTPPASIGVGRSLRLPGDHHVAEIGDEIAVARALGDLSQRLLTAAGTAVATANGRPPTPLAR